jgi:hypothetical protein
VAHALNLYVQIADEAVLDDGLHDSFIEAQQQLLASRE